MLEEQDDFAAINPPGPTSTATESSSGPPAVHRTVHFRGRPLALETRWGVGIGGDIWTTGSLLCQFLERRHAFFERVFRGARILELGSGTGLVGLCVASAHSSFDFAEVVITDQADHLPLIRRNARANGLPLAATTTDEDPNPHPSPTTCDPCSSSQKHRRLRVQEFDWVSGAGVAALGARPFDVVLGTDVAYCPELYAPVIKALETVAGPRTLVILGVTRTDTGPPFFRMLREAGFDYCLLRTEDLDGAGGGVASGFALISVVRRSGELSVAGQ